ncbi:MAG: putative phosphodiesterase [Bacteroidetes bacterium]|nr:putative phosphodiesterase [Bacteroidota bacterium]
MRFAVISDIHSNIQALTRALATIDERGADKIYCLGDIVGYGGNPNECVDLIRARAALCVLGNHDMAAVDPEHADYFSRPGRIAIEWTHSVLTQQNIEFLASLPFVASTEVCTLVHASPLDPPLWQYVLSLQVAKPQFQAFSTPICFIGHTHVPGICGEDLKTFVLKKGKRFLINVGSVGQPRDGNPQLSFGFFDVEAWKYENIRVTYDIDKAAQAIRIQGLPSTLATRLYQGV